MHTLMSWGTGLMLIFASVPASQSYTLKSYDFGTGGGSSSSTNYKLNGSSGEQSGSGQLSGSYGQVSGVNITQDANQPAAPTVTNPATYYDKLKVVINSGSNPGDTKYLVAISNDNWTTTNYVQADDSVGSSQATGNYQTYATWGGTNGFLVLGLSPSTTYQLKVKALQGNFSGSAFSPVASASTAAPSLSFGLTTSLSSTPPFSATFASLTAGSVVNANADGIVALTSNADNGGSVYIVDSSSGLYSPSATTTIASASGDLGTASAGYGAQVTAATQTGGGPFTSLSPFNGTATTVGALSTAYQPILTSTTAIGGGSGTVRMMAKASTTTPAASDYSDVLTFIAAMHF